MIKKIVLKNFQIHKKLILEFDPGFNTITGTNDAGKSSAVRALYWLCFNKPLGNWMRRITPDGKQKTAMVKVVLQDGTTIKRVKGKHENYYELNGERYDNSKQIPPDIIEALKIKPISINKQDFTPNIGLQNEPLFMIEESSVTRGCVINHITGMDLVWKAMKLLNHDKTELGREIRATESVLKQNQKELRQLPKVKNLIKQKDKLMKQYSQYDQSKKTVDDMKEYRGKIKLLKRELYKQEQILKNFASLPDGSKFENNLRRYKELKSIHNRLTTVQSDYKKASKIANNEFRSTLESAEQLVERSKGKISKLNMLNTFVDKYQRVKNFISALEEQIVSLEQTLRSSVGKICESCGQEILEEATHVGH